MSKIFVDALFHVMKIKATFIHQEFSDQIIKVDGTGFWMSVNNKKIFVTNKHNVDSRLKLGENSLYGLKKFEIQLRKNETTTPTTETSYFEVSNLDLCLKIHATSDCSILIDPQFRDCSEDFLLFKISIKDSHFASRDFFSSLKEISLPGSFIGFPLDWHDDYWQLPISRPMMLSSCPQIPFTSSHIKTSDVQLVSGLSFQGSSGSLAWLHGDGWKKNLTGDVTGLIDCYTPPIIVGIMSGHFWEKDEFPSMFKKHSGLSYYTRSTSILDLIEEYN